MSFCVRLSSRGYYKFTSKPYLYENKKWETTKAGWSFLTALSNMHENALVSYSDIVLESTIEKIIESNGDITITVDSHWRSRYAGRAFEDLDKCEKVCLSQVKLNF